MTSTRHRPARFLITASTLTGLALVSIGCSSSTPKATPNATTATSTTAQTVAATDSPYCQTARKWTAHELSGDGDTMGSDPVAFKKYWGEYLDFVATATQQAPPEIAADWPVAHDFVVQQFTPVLEKYDFDIERAKAEGTPAELAIGARMDAGPSPTEQRAQDAIHEYEGTVCGTAQPKAADVSFAGAQPDQDYCEAAQAADGLVQDNVVAKKWSVDAVRALLTGAAYGKSLDQLETTAPDDIKEDVRADAEWSRNEQVAVLERFGYDARKLLVDGTASDRAVFQHSDPAIAGHYARVEAYEEQVCGKDS